MSDIIKKIYVDSRFRTSGTDSNFTIRLDQSVLFEEKTKMYITDIILPNSIPIINTLNQFLYINIFYDSTHFYRYIYISPGMYNATSFSEELTQSFSDAISDLEVVITCSYNAINNLIEFKLTDNRASKPDVAYVQIYCNNDIKNGLTAFGVNNPTKSANNIIGIPNNINIFIQESTPYYGYLDLHQIRALYMTSGALTNYDTLSTFNMTGIIKKIPMRANFNDLIFDNLDSVFDYVEVGRRGIDTLDFQLRNTNGDIVDLQGAHISFTIIFSKF